MVTIEVGFIAYKNESGLYDRKVPIMREVSKSEAKAIREDYINKWGKALHKWFIEIMEGNDENNSAG